MKFVSTKERALTRTGMLVPGWSGPRCGTSAAVKYRPDCRHLSRPTSCASATGSTPAIGTGCHISMPSLGGSG